jgi:hypothetical protein
MAVLFQFEIVESSQSMLKYGRPSNVKRTCFFKLVGVSSYPVGVCNALPVYCFASFNAPTVLPY